MEVSYKKRYYSIGELAKSFNVNPSKIRFWEKEFDILSPKKSQKGTRRYSEKDIEIFRLIYHLVEEQGYTLEGAKTKIKEKPKKILSTIEITTENGIATLEFSHSQANCLPLDFLYRLADELGKLSVDDTVKVVLLRSAGEKTFCAGAFFDELSQVDSLEKGKEFFSGFALVLNAIRQCKKPIIGRAQGKAVGGGVGILACCDYVFATEQASIRLPELSIGIGPFVIAPVIERKMGIAALSELSFDPEQWKNAYWAEKKGLFARVFENISDMDKEIDYFLRKLSSYPIESLVEIKKILWKSTPSWENLLFENASISGKLALSDFTKNKIAKKNK